MAHTEASDPTLGKVGGALGAIDRLLHRIEKLTAQIFGLSIFALMLVGVVHVLGRKFFDMPIFGYIDIVEIMMVFMVFLAIAFTERLGGHIRMELFVGMLRGRWLAVFELVGVVLGLAVVGVLLVYSWDHAMRAFYLGDSTIDAQIPLWPSKLIVPISLAILFVRLLVSLAAYMRVILDPSKKLIAVPDVIDAEEQALREAQTAVAFEPSAPAASGTTRGRP